MKEMIGSKDGSQKSFIAKQDLSTLSNGELKLLKEKAVQLKDDLIAIHKRFLTIPFQNEGEAVFKGLLAVHSHLENPICKLTGEGVKMLGLPQKPPTKGQIDELLTLIDNETLKRS